MGKCDKCFYQEFYKGEFICKHICSMQGIEGSEPYRKCKMIKSCEYYKKSKKGCMECDGIKSNSCWSMIINGICPKCKVD